MDGGGSGGGGDGDWGRVDEMGKHVYYMEGVGMAAMPWRPGEALC